MSIPTLPMCCDRCGQVVNIRGFSPSVYRLPDDTGLPLRWTLRWCIDCDTVRQFESIPSGAKLEQEREDLLLVRQTRDQKIAQRGWLQRLLNQQPRFSYEEEKVDADLGEHALYAMLYAKRTDQGHCLDCGASAFTALDWISETAFVHPACGGTFNAQEEEEGIRFNFGRSARVYSLDGSFVGSAWEFDYQTRQLTMRDVVQGRGR